MTCHRFTDQIDHWHAGTLSDTEAAALEAHAVGCVDCEAALDRPLLSVSDFRELSPPPELRAVTFAAVSRRRHWFRWWPRTALGAGIAAAVFFLMVGRPESKSATDFPGAGKQLLAMELARAEFTELDLAESEVAGALRSAPNDSELLAALQRIRRQREALQQLVRKAPE